MVLVVKGPTELLFPDPPGITVEFDSTFPEKTRDVLGQWWEGRPAMNPKVLIPGTISTDGIGSYETISVESPIFDENQLYVPQRIEGNLPSICIVRRREVDGVWEYKFTYSDHWDVYEATEAELLRFLTHEVDPADLVRERA